MKIVVVTLVATVAAGLAAAAPAAAASPAPQTLQGVKTLVQSRIDGRLHTLTALRTAVDGATGLTGAHKSTLTTLVATDATGLTNLRDKVGGETAISAVRDDERTMVDSYRIYLLVTPKVRLTIAADAETVAVKQLSSVRDKLSTAITAAQSTGKDVSTEQSELSDLSTQVNGVGTQLSGKVDGLLAVRPGPDATAITNAVNPVRTAVHGARDDLKKGVADAKQISQQLAAG
jgi:hypothetical protein